MNIFSPAEVAANACNAGKSKGDLALFPMIILGILAGAYIGFGANLATVVGADGGSKFLFGAVFSVGLMMVVIGGAELFTGNNMFLTICALNGQTTWGKLLYNWVVVYFANFAGSLLLVFIIFSGMFWIGTNAEGGLALSAIGVKAVSIAQGKLTLTWSSAFCRAICCNWLVCMAVWLALTAKDTIGKIFAIFFPIMAFVTSGFEHSVANMYFIPMGITIVNKVPELAIAAGFDPTLFTYGNFIMNNLIPVTLGNIVGGGFFVAGLYYLAYLRPAKVAAAKKDSAVSA
ncbi:MAG: formate/nitrite transporter family protein [Syntrophomonadaceae bacterium]|nr:formate/nitrite transporter family protein [Syntrophomonadaceae bacterium]